MKNIEKKIKKEIKKINLYTQIKFNIENKTITIYNNSYQDVYFLEDYILCDYKKILYELIKIRKKIINSEKINYIINNKGE